MRLLIATGNQGKAKELQRILEHLHIQVVMPADIGVTLEVEETGTTFLENATIKALAFYQATGIPTLADDSGLCIDILEGKPGVYTARYGGAETPYPEKIELLLKELQGIPKERRTAYFESGICCVLSEDRVLTTTGTVNGWIGFVPSGTGGFGYDPIFYVGETSFAQMDPEKKDDLSHRGIALRKMAKKLEQVLEEKGALS